MQLTSTDGTLVAQDVKSDEAVLPVVVDAPRYSGLPCLSYAAAQAWPAGTLVRVPLGKRDVPGIVWDPAAPQDEAETGRAPAGLRPIREALDPLPPLGPHWRALVGFAATYYQRAIGEVALAVLPPMLRQLDAPQLAKRLQRLARRLADRAPEAAPPAAVPALTAEQAEALDGIEVRGTHLIVGATGSGKTEVYLRAVERTLAQGQQALVLVPEINLTPQLEARFRARFGGRLIVAQHSAQTPAQRLQHWLAAHLGHADIVLGTRLAVFASLPRLGLIVVDEEHDPSYKQQDGARYSARDLAVYRAHQESVPVLLGSATPSMESWQAAEQGRYRRLLMPSRVGGGAWPALRLVDLAGVPREALRQSAVAPALLQALRDRIARGEQSLVLLNRRGYAPALHCPDCGWKSGCPHCSAWRVFHKADRTLRCHHCGLAERVPRACPDCGNLDIQPVGRGTERLEEQLAQLLPQARLARIDADTTRRKGALEAQLASVHDGEVDVLVGTQMVAKGHDFRRITLVAAVNPDGALFSSDFRAGERLFALLMQAAGRAGRDAQLAGRAEVWVQTYHPRHPLFAALARHDLAAFAASTLAEREQAGLPPYAHLALLRAEGRSVEAAQAFLQDATAAGEALMAEGQSGPVLYPPVPMPVQRVADVERLQMLVECRARPVLQRFLADWTPRLHALRSQHKGLVRWAVDVDPLLI